MHPDIPVDVDEHLLTELVGHVLDAAGVDLMLAQSEHRHSDLAPEIRGDNDYALVAAVVQHHLVEGG